MPAAGNPNEETHGTRGNGLVCQDLSDSGCKIMHSILLGMRLLFVDVCAGPSVLVILSTQTNKQTYKQQQTIRPVDYK